MNVRPAGPRDVPALAALAARTLRETYAADHDPAQLERQIAETLAPDRLAAEVADPGCVTLLAHIGDEPAAYATLRSDPAPACVAGPDTIELARIYVLRRHQREGVGSALLAAALAEAQRRRRRTMWLSVWDRNARALAFYRRWGFADAGTAPFTFGGVEYDDLILARPVAGGDIRPIRAGEGAALRAVRLRALRESPGAFLTTAGQAEALPAEEWAERARAGDGSGDRVTFLAWAADGPCGMATGIPDPARPGTVELVQVWVDPAHRGRSIGRRLVEAVVGWCAERGVRVRLGVADDHPAAVSLYLSAGFVPTGETEPHPARPEALIRWFEREAAGPGETR
jgi:ribosomal protein S18 acetylase RimI-like enzyme